MLDWVYPQTVAIVTSKYNGRIKVVRNRGQYSVWVGGFEQSGNFYVQKIWKAKLDEIKKDVKSALVLGLGCGTVVKLISAKWPDVKIVGVEIDPVMVALGKKYFNLSLEVVNADARKFVKTTQKKFDLILVDAYFGDKKENVAIPKKLLTKNGIIITNNLNGIVNELVVEFGDV